MKRVLFPLLALLFAALAWLQALDRLAEEHAEAGFKRAIASFATARALNAVISVVQGTEVTGGVVVGVKLAPGQVLDPVNDLIEQFSSLMLAASIAFGAQLMLMQIGASWLTSAALTVLALAWAWPWLRGRAPPRLLSRALFALLLVRFVVPVAALGSEAAYQAFMADDYRLHQQGIERAADALAVLPEEVESSTRWWDVPARIAELREAAERIVDHTIRLAVVFLLQTLVLPLLLMWMLARAGGLLLRGATS